MKPFETAIWFNADIAGERASALVGVEEAFLRAGVINAVRFGPIQIEDVSPEDSRLPPPPDYMTGNVRCLIGTAVPVGKLEEEPPSKFVDELSPKDLAAMRASTRRMFSLNMTDEECDEVINIYGPDAAVDTL